MGENEKGRKKEWDRSIKHHPFMPTGKGLRNKRLFILPKNDQNKQYLQSVLHGEKWLAFVSRSSGGRLY